MFRGRRCQRLGSLARARPRAGARRGRSAAGHGPAAPAGAGAASARGGRAFRLGEDVVHAAFGEGVVTGVEPGGVIVVRFAGDGSERKLMAEYAPRQPPLSARRCSDAEAHSIRAMSARIIDGKAIAARVRGEVAGEVRGLRRPHGRAPGPRDGARRR